MSSSNSTDSVTQVKEWTEYQKITFSYQHSSRKKVGSLLGRGIGLTIGGIIITIILILGMGFLQQGSNIIILGAGLLGLGMFFYGVFMVFQAIFSKKRSVTCPYCGTAHTLIRSTRSYVCDSCAHVLRFAGEEDNLCKVACPHCGLEWAASINTGKTNCFSCGATATITNGAVQFSTETLSCTSCNTTNPAGSYFCWKCGTFLTPPNPVESPEFNQMSESYNVKPNADGMDFVSIRANTSIGLIVNCVSRLNAVIGEANQLPDNSYFNWKPVQQVEHSLEGMEVAIDQNPEYASLVRTLLPIVTQLMARLMKGVKIGTSSYGSDKSFNTYWRGLSTTFNRLTKKANPGVNLPSRENEWPEQLLNVKLGGSVGTSNPPQFETILTNESDLKNWVSLNLPAQPLQALVVPISHAKS